MISGYNDNLPLHETLRLSHCVGAPMEKLKALTNGVERRNKNKTVDIIKMNGR